MTLIFIQDTINTSPEATNWPLVLHQALGQDNNDHQIKDAVSGFQKAQPEKFVEQLVNQLNIPTKFLRMAAHTVWDDDIYLQVARRLRSHHTNDANLAQWVDTAIMERTSPLLHTWQLHWAVLCENLSVVERLLHNNVQSDGVFLSILASGGKELFEVVAPFARATLHEPIYTLAFAHRISQEHENFEWIDRLLEQYTCEEVCEQISLSNPTLLDDLRNYVVQYYLKELPSGSSIKSKKI